MTFEATFSDSYGLRECLTIELKFKCFLLLWEISVLKTKNLHGKWDRAILGSKHSKSKIIFMKLKICFIQNHLCAVGQWVCFVSKLHFLQQFHFVHIFHIKFNKYVRTCKRKLRSELVPRWTNWIMGDTAAVISRLSYYFLLRNSNLKWPNPISLLKTIFEMC